MRNAIMIFVVCAASAVAHAAPQHPEVHVTIAAASNAPDDAARKAHADTIRHLLFDAFKCNNTGPWQFGLDVSVVKLATATVGGYIEVSAELHVVISDEQGRMISFVTGAAKVQVPCHSFRPTLLAKYQKQAIEDATGDLVRPLRAQVLRAAARRAAPDA